MISRNYLGEEEEKLRQRNLELQEQENRHDELKERVKAPIIWKRLASGIKIQDLKPKYYDEVIRILEECYFDEEILFRIFKVNKNPVSIKIILNLLLLHLQDQKSIIALDETNGDAIVGFLILKPFNKNDFGPVEIIEGEAHKKCLAFMNRLIKQANVFGVFNCELFLRYILLCIRPEYRKKGLGIHLLLSGMDVARSLQIPVIMGVLTSLPLQKLAMKIGIKVIHEISYENLMKGYDEMDNAVEKHTCVVMARLVPPPLKREAPPVIKEEEKKEKKKKKKNKKEKKGKKGKKSKK